MPYKITPIQSAASIISAKALSISNILWNSKEAPTSFGKIGYIPNKAIIIQLLSNQSNPLRTYYEINSPVYKDSALEFFLQAELDNPNYLNFELNANGAMIVQWGSTQANRTYLPEKQIKNCIVKAEIKEDCWNIFLHIPLKFLKFFYPNFHQSQFFADGILD